MRLWDLDSGDNLLINYGTVSNESRKSVKLSVSRNCSPELVFVPEDSDISMFDMYSGVKLDSLRGHYKQVNCCLFVSETQQMFSGANDHNILVWAPQTTQTTTYDEHLQGDQSDTKQTNFTQRVGTMDNWSDDDSDS